MATTQSIVKDKPLACTMILVHVGPQSWAVDYRQLLHIEAA